MGGRCEGGPRSVRLGRVSCGPLDPSPLPPPLMVRSWGVRAKVWGERGAPNPGHIQGGERTAVVKSDGCISRIQAGRGARRRSVDDGAALRTDSRGKQVSKVRFPPGTEGVGGDTKGPGECWCVGPLNRPTGAATRWAVTAGAPPREAGRGSAPRWNTSPLGVDVSPLSECIRPG